MDHPQKVSVPHPFSEKKKNGAQIDASTEKQTGLTVLLCPCVDFVFSLQKS